MKINKTEEEFRRVLRPAVSQLGSATLESRLDAIIAALDIEFTDDPKTKRVWVQHFRLKDSDLGVPVIMPHGTCILEDSNKIEKTAREAAARYHVFDFLVKWLVHQASYCGNTIEATRVLDVIAGAVMRERIEVSDQCARTVGAVNDE